MENFPIAQLPSRRAEKVNRPAFKQSTARVSSVQSQRLRLRSRHEDRAVRSVIFLHAIGEVDRLSVGRPARRGAAAFGVGDGSEHPASDLRFLVSAFALASTRCRALRIRRI